MKNDWLNDYQEFIESEKVEVPVAVQTTTLFKIKTMLNPGALIVFLKVLAIHMVIGFLSLSVCHQFGMNPFNTERSLDNYMMSFGGHYFCMFGCGVLFVSLSLLSAGYFLTIEEVKALRRTEVLQILVLGMISLSLFMVFGVELAAGIAAIWLLGALLGGLITTESMWRFKQV
jgi:hypothetical protein